MIKLDGEKGRVYYLDRGWIGYVEDEPVAGTIHVYLRMGKVLSFVGESREKVLTWISGKGKAAKKKVGVT